MLFGFREVGEAEIARSVGLDPTICRGLALFPTALVII